ncbi:carboxymuconolactone decarboxylase family protein [Piscinibacter sp.]|jgi:AhpD family alkylhydroperoxidase|uniref:carboxymuconolactone decarboxylase family protein n=1 Tax=Piscinibacter sp. TaxID=1903157 RepID=UPI002F4060D4
MTESTRAERPSFYRTLADRHPAFMQALDGLGVAVRQAGPLDEKTVQLVQLAAAAATRSEGGVHSHTRRALACGVTPEAIRHALIALTSTVGFPTVVAALSWAEDQLAKADGG